ncbi:hypothetical protein N7491_010563 [Penicillium cf. griseofulvum]|uniref:NWD NACHT-NTPase N-terminal domain-containing protein n=1 Tax=Penicillium cf. griseofulvum TaxID=2972120 RepID=A0A9W9T5Z0_9EURO|nr:hypothetical protein N7472_000893 [Penicillium cf. griseofulvum]KAJ5422118.1 hypothetical protein N7491_010563 [Penicillium cf. griseofulvum]KAJ5428306.1 hypothetical protein N7445_009760 [Penicillium cf. griseofulvum]
MRRFLKFKRREASSGDPQGNSVITSSPPTEPETITPSAASKPASNLKVQDTCPSVVTASPSPTIVSAAQPQTGQAVASLSRSTCHSPAPSVSASWDIDAWNRAYEVAGDREPELMTDYTNHLASLQGNPTSKRNISSSEFVEDVVNQLLDDREKKQWRLPLLGSNVIIRKQAEKLAKVLLWSDPVVQRALSTQPYAALAWSSVSILLPLLTSAVTPDEAMLKSFNSISDVQIYWTIFEETYLTSAHRQHYENLIEPLIKLYSNIIEYQARAICHLSKTQLSRGWQNVAGWNDWAGKASEVETLSKALSSLIVLDNEKEIRERWDRQLREIQESSTILKEIQQALDESRRQIQGNYEDKTEKELLQDLASDYEGYKDFNRLRVQGTCEWFFNDDKFCNWRDSSTSGLLWLSAGPGCGKSTLSRALIDERRLSLNVTTSTVCHFFFKDGYEDRMYGVNALCAVLHQLFTRDSSGDLIKLALPAHKNYGKALTRSFSELWNILLACAKSPHAGEIICIFDALDECEKQSRLQLIKKLEEFYSQPQGLSALSSKLRFLITSRPYADIEGGLGSFSTADYLHFDGDKKSPAIKREIDLVIDEHVSQIVGNFTPDDQLEISKRIKSMENRTYLWLHVIFETIKEDPSRHGKRSSIQKLLNNIPCKLSEAYERILSRSKCQEETERLLEIIVAAARPLTLDEANVALTLALSEESFTSHAALENDLWPKNNFESIVKGLSGLFISVHDSKLFFIHQTAREFLIGPSARGTWEGRLSMSESSRTMSRTCCQFLVLPDLRALAGTVSFSTTVRALNQLPPFFRYAADHWSLHFLSQEATIIDQTLNDARTLCNRHQAWVRVATPRWSSIDFQIMTDLSLASYLGLKQVIENILSEEHIDIHTEDESSISALSAACFAGLSDVVTLLLNKGANCNSNHLQNGTALHAALLSGHRDIVSILLENGADVNSKSRKSGSALYIASTYNYPDVVLALLERGADINYSEGLFGTALDGACREGHHEVVKILLENGADVNSKGGSFGTTLYIASSHNQPDIVLGLIERGADINYTHELFGTALHGACYRGHREVVKILLENGADVNSQGGSFGTTLYIASTQNYPDIVTILLENGADVNYYDPMDGTALLGACHKGYREVVKILLEHGAVDLKHGYYGSALHAACDNLKQLDVSDDIDQSQIAILLLKNGPDADMHYNHQTHGTPLQTASKRGGELVVEILLAIGADPNVRGGDGSSAIQEASLYGHQGVVELLLKNGADVNLQGEGKSTALQMAAREGRRELVALLLDHGADVTIKGELYGTALDAATEHGDTEIVEMLVKRGAE